MHSICINSILLVQNAFYRYRACAHIISFPEFLLTLQGKKPVQFCPFTYLLAAVTMFVVRGKHLQTTGSHRIFVKLVRSQMVCYILVTKRLNFTVLCMTITLKIHFSSKLNFVLENKESGKLFRFHCVTLFQDSITITVFDC